jgi:hypothetical protein
MISLQAASDPGSCLRRLGPCAFSNLQFDEDAPTQLDGRRTEDVSSTLMFSVGVQNDGGLRAVGRYDDEFEDKEEDEPWVFGLATPAGVARLVTDVGQKGVAGCDACFKGSKSNFCLTVIMSERKKIDRRWSHQGKSQPGGGMLPKQHPGSSMLPCVPACDHFRHCAL